MPDGAGPLLAELRGTAAAAAAARVAAARTEADDIRAAARAGAQAERTAALAAHEREAKAASARTRAETEARVGRDTLTARAAALDRVFAQAAREATALAAHPELAGILASTLTDGLSYLPAGAANVVCGTAVAGAVRSALAAAKRDDVTVRADDAAPFGLVIESADGSLAIDCTFAARLASERPRLSAEIARRLVEERK